jgi:hypothetical protein
MAFSFTNSSAYHRLMEEPPRPSRDSSDADYAPPSHTAPELEPPHWSLWLLYLVFRPKSFFETFVIRSVPVLTAITAWIYGTAGVMDRIETRVVLSSRSNPIYDVMRQDWLVYWIGAAVLGLLGGAMYYAIGGWWYSVRLRWSGAQNPDRYLARRVYIYSAQAYAVPYLLYTAWESTTYASPAAASNADDVWAFLVIAAMFWSIYISYRGVRTAFDVRRWLARLWFLILPGIVYATTLLAVIMALLGGYIGGTPDLTNTKRIERSAFTLQYPGNWEVDTADETYDPDSDFGIGPTFLDAQLQFWFYPDPLNSADCVSQTLENLSAAYEVTGSTEVGEWGRFEGAGISATALIEGGTFNVLMFCATEQQPPFEIMQICESSICDQVQPGFALIRDSLELHSAAGP